MWSSEVERKGVIECSRFAYGLLVVSSMVYISAFIIPFILTFISVYSAFADKRVIGFWIIFTIFSVLFLTAYSFSKIGWAILKKKAFVYDYHSNKCSWNGRKPHE